MRIEAQPDAIGAAGSRQAMVGDRLVELSGRLTSATSGADAAGDAAVVEAMTGAIQSWQASLAMISDSVAAIGTNLSGASSAYTAVDESAIPAG